MNTNEIPPKTLIELCSNVLRELEYWTDCMVADNDEGTNDDNINRVMEIIKELDFVKLSSINRDREFRDLGRIE